MTKRGSRKKHINLVKQPTVISTESTTVDSTTDDLSPLLYNKMYLFNREDITTADDISEDSSGINIEQSPGKGRTYPDMIIGLFSGVINFRFTRLLIFLVLCWLFLSSYLFIQDNGNDKLDTSIGINWYIYKLQIISIGVFIVSLIIIFIEIIDYLLKGNKSKKN